jgi:phosphoribosylformylglycinamidine synthase II
MAAITADLISQHQLSEEEYESILRLLGREPTITELGIFSVMWSEHCSYKSSRIHLKKLPTEGPRVLEGPGENAGVVDIGSGYAVAFKIESHNHPSFIEPFQGAATGVGGILRDIFTMGARPIAVMDSLRFGPIGLGPGDASSDAARNRRILEGVVGGIAHYGNCFGVPTVGGECVFEPCYSGNPLVNVFALGVFRRDEIFYARASGIGNPVIYVGAKTGRDGIHGASMASAEFDEQSMEKRPNVQVGDPFLEKLLLEACLEAMQTGAVVGIQDMGAAGLTCSTCEMGGRAGTGIEIDLMHVPQRESGMTPYEIMLSESQERMLLVAERGREEEIFRIFRKWGLDAATIGQVTGDGKLRVKDHGKVVAEIPNAALANQAPLYRRPAAAPFRTAPLDGPAIVPRSGRQLREDLAALMASADICSKRYIWEQYDYTVRTNTIQGPGADAAVVRIKETGTSIAMSLDGNGRYCYLGPREGARLAVAECCRNISCVGAEPVAATNCLNFGNPERPEIMGQFVEAIEGMGEACRFFGVPITGGNVSLYNETLGEPIYPTPVIGVIGLLPTRRPPPVWFQNTGRKIVLLGGLLPGPADQRERRFGSSQFAKVILGKVWGLPPALDMDYEQRVQRAAREMIGRGLVESAHDISDGGLAVAVAESSFGPARTGARLALESGGLPLHYLLFHEAPSRILVTAEAANLQAIFEIAARYGIDAPAIGETSAGELTFEINGLPLFTASVDALYEAWAGALRA